MFRIGDVAARGTRVVWAAVIVAVVLAGQAALTTASQAAVGATWKLHQLDRDRCWDAATMDADGNGLTEDIRYDIDNDCRWDTRLWNSVGRDSFLESLTFDMNEDGHWESWLADTDKQEGFDVVYYDDNADGGWDRWNYARKAPDSSLLSSAQAGCATCFVGGSPQYAGAMALVLWLAARSGTVAWSPPDYDNDGWPDDIDRRPTDSYRH